MNIKEIREMIQLMNENNLSEFELEKEGLKIRLRKGAGGAIEQSVSPAEAPAPTGAVSRSKEETAKDQAASRHLMIKSPMVGTFYSAPAPDAPPYVQAGSQVEIGQVVCVIEAMKLMNEIKSEVRGKVVEVAVHNGDPVEFGQTIFIVE